MERKRKGGAEKLRDKKRLALQANAAKCGKISEMFATAGPSSAPVSWSILFLLINNTFWKCIMRPLSLIAFNSLHGLRYVENSCTVGVRLLARIFCTALDRF